MGNHISLIVNRVNCHRKFIVLFLIHLIGEVNLGNGSQYFNRGAYRNFSKELKTELIFNAHHLCNTKLQQEFHC